jgi:hypothetical protein
MNKTAIFDWYTDYLQTSFSDTTATGLSQVKRMIYFLSWHFDPTVNRSVKGINWLNCRYSAKAVSLPVAFEWIKKSLRYSDVKTRKEKRKSPETKHEQLRNMWLICQQNQLKWHYVLADSGFSSSENMKFIHQEVKKYFILALKSNRLVALTEEDKWQSHYVRIDTLNGSEEPVIGWVKGLEFPVLFHRQVFKNKDESTGLLYLISNDVEATKTMIEATYPKRWKVEVCHKNIKSNTGFATSPAKTVRTQSNHIFMSIYAGAKLECLSIKNGLNTLALKRKLYLKAISQAFNELQILKQATA